MTAWWMRTTTVRKVRARSSDRLRVRAVGAAWTSAATVGEIIDVMARPGSVVAVVGHPSSARHRHARNHGGAASRHGGDPGCITPNDIYGPVVGGRGRRAAHWPRPRRGIARSGALGRASHDYAPRPESRVTAQAGAERRTRRKAGI